MHAFAKRSQICNSLIVHFSHSQQKDSFQQSQISKLLNIVSGYLLKPLQFKSPEENAKFISNAGKVLYCLSAINPSVVTKVCEIIQTGVEMKDSEELNNQYYMIEHLNMNLEALEAFLLKVGQNAQSYAKKGNRQVALTRVIRNAIWNWITNYPEEFAELYKTEKRLRGFFCHLPKTNK